MNLKIGHKINQWSHQVRQEDLNSWSKILNDPNPIHFDANAVKKIGQGDKCINQGPANIAYLINTIFYNFPKCKILNIKNRLNGNVFVDDIVTVSGEITNISNKNESRIISLSLNLSTQENNYLVVSEVELIQ
tara:strand:+ start:125 stop:523 length:399 start_codon:yes stop_codon:yes gene_type:complete